MNYARSTAVTEAESRAEIETLLKRSGCDEVVVGLNRAGAGVVCFTRRGRAVRMLLELPENGSRERPRRWRVLLLVLKAKLEAMDAGISTFDAEFLAFIRLDDGQSAGQFMASRLPQLAGRTA